jgi:hypothetical protein
LFHILTSEKFSAAFFAAIAASLRMMKTKKVAMDASTVTMTPIRVKIPQFMPPVSGESDMAVITAARGAREQVRRRGRRQRQREKNCLSRIFQTVS